MALEVKRERQFIFKEDVLQDLNPAMTTEQIRSMYVDRYPDLAIAEISGPVLKDNKAIYTFDVKVGTKG